jgi:hypothetical protein
VYDIVRCDRHPGARAAWRCGSCGAALCPGCAREERTGPTVLPICARCGGLAQVLRVHRSRLRPFSARLAGTLAYPFSLSGVATLAAVAGIVTLLSYVGCIGKLLGLGIHWGVLFSLIRATARGSADIEPADFADLFEDVLLPAVRGTAATALAWAPAVAYLFAVHGSGLLHDPASALSDPLLWIILVLSIAYVPMAVMMAAAGGGLLQMLNPLAVFGAVRALGADYALAVGSVVLLAIGQGVAIAVGAVVAAAPLPLLPNVAAGIIGLYFPVVMARVLGLLLHVRGDAVGYGVDEDFLEPAVPDARPRGGPAGNAAPESGGVAGASATPGAEPEPVAEPILETRIAAIDLTPREVDVPTPRPAADFGPEPAPDPAPAAPPPWSPTPADVEEAVRGGDLQRAVELYGALGADAAGLASSVHYEVARAAAAARDYLLSVRALELASIDPADPVTPVALLALGRIRAGRLGDREGGAAALRRLVDQHPGTQAADRGREELEKMG